MAIEADVAVEIIKNGGGGGYGRITLCGRRLHKGNCRSREGGVTEENNDLARVEVELLTEVAEVNEAPQESGDPFIDEILGASWEEKDLEDVVKAETNQNDSFRSEKLELTPQELVLNQKNKEDSVACELEIEMARAESAVLELAVQNNHAIEHSRNQNRELAVLTLNKSNVTELDSVELLVEDVDDSALLAETLANIEEQLKPRVVEIIEEVAFSEFEKL